MFTCNRWETKVIMEGRASGCSRVYGNGCPHRIGGELVLTSRYLDLEGRDIPFAKAQVVSIRPGTVGEFRRDKMLAEIDGYANGEVWFGQMNQMYKGLKDTDKVYHIKFRIIEIDKQAGRRGDLPPSPVQ
jgi:hypothetical protein